MDVYRSLRRMMAAEAFDLELSRPSYMFGSSRARIGFDKQKHPGSAPTK